MLVLVAGVFALDVLTPLVEHVHRAPVGDPLHRQPGQLGDGDVVVQRRGEGRARFGQEPVVLLRLQLGREIAGDAAAGVGTFEGDLEFTFTAIN